MCFNGDYEWRASTVDETEGPAAARTKCDECHRWINAGEWMKHIYMQEHEACQRCEDSWSDNYEENHPDCADGEHDYGETFEKASPGIDPDGKWQVGHDGLVHARDSQPHAMKREE
jgi:hypothetical protein